MDVWHAMARIKVPKEHGFHQPFAIALRDAIFIPNAEDKEQISAYLISVNSSWEEKLHLNAAWLWKRCRRIIPPPDKLFKAVQEVYAIYGPLKDAKTSKPLFSPSAWKDARNILKAIKAGLLSDPPGISLHVQVGIDNDHGKLPIYRCLRGTNATEGGIHLSIRHWLSISGASPHHASAQLHDYVYVHNLVVGTKNRTGKTYRGHYDIELTNQLQVLLSDTTIQLLVPDAPVMKGWINGDLYIPGNERIGILPVPDQLCSIAEIASYSHIDDQDFKHSFLAQQQGTKYAVMAVHTQAERAQFKRFLQEHPAFNQSGNQPNWKLGAKTWNRLANGINIFYKVDSSLFPSLWG